MDSDIILNNRVRTILVLGYRVLANTGRYWGGSGIWRYFFDCETWYWLLISAHATPPAAVCCLNHNQTAIGGGGGHYAT